MNSEDDYFALKLPLKHIIKEQHIIKQNYRAF